MLAFAAAGSSASWCCPCWNIALGMYYELWMFQGMKEKLPESCYTCGKRELPKSHCSARKSPQSKLSHFWSTLLFNNFHHDEQILIIIFYYDYIWRRCKYKNIFSELIIFMWVVDWQFSQEESAYRAHWRPCGSRREPHVCFLPCCTPVAPATFHKLPFFYKHFSWDSLFTRPATIRAK